MLSTRCTVEGLAATKSSGRRTGEHQRCEPAVAVERMEILEVEDGLALDGGEPMVAGNAAIGFVRLDYMPIQAMNWSAGSSVFADQSVMKSRTASRMSGCTHVAPFRAPQAHLLT